MSQEVSKENKMRILGIVEDIQMLLHKQPWHMEDVSKVMTSMGWLQIMERDLRKDIDDPESTEETRADA